MPDRILLSLLIFVLLTSGCTTSVVRQKPPNNAQSVMIDPAAKAQQLAKQGLYREAAKEYLQLAARMQPPVSLQYQIEAVRALLSGQLITEARAELSRIQANAWPELVLQVTLLHVQLALVEQRLDDALSHLGTLGNAMRLPPSIRPRYHELYAQVLAAKGDWLASIKERLLLNSLPGQTAKERQMNHDQIWRTVTAVDNSTLLGVPQQAGDVLSGWIALALLSRSAKGGYLAQALNSWRVMYPDHPANEHIVSTLNPVPGSNLPLAANRITILLPLGGRYAAQSEAILNGFNAAWYGDRGADKPEIAVQDVNIDTVVQLYQQAVYSGSRFIVGPLEREVLDTLVKQLPLSVPTLSLNYLTESLSVPNLYQFGLSPENEAREVANRAWSDGYRSASSLFPTGGWGERVSQAFNEEWLSLGGQFRTSHAYGKDVATSVREVLNESWPVDMMFVVAFPNFMRQIQPFFRYYMPRAHLPLYSTSHVYSGVANVREDRDLEGLIFGDMPWILATDEQTKQIKSSLAQTWPANAQRFTRLYAMGLDAYQIVRQLQKSTTPVLNIKGYTGHLTFDSQNRVQRGLSWARFQGGVAVPLQE